MTPYENINSFFCLLAIGHTFVGQNIVPNANFATDSLCPWSGGLMNYCKMWRTATMASPDYFNGTANNVGISGCFPSDQEFNCKTYSSVYIYNTEVAGRFG